MTQNALAPALEALLFAGGDPMPLARLAEALGQPEGLVEQAAEALQKRLCETGSGLAVVRLGDCYQLTTLPAHAEAVRRLLELRRAAPLSQAALEALAVVAYHQPVTRAYVEQVRGVDCGGVLATLTEKELIEECGRLDLPGRPLLYRTTPHFLRCFSLASLEDLPPVPTPESPEAEESAGDSATE